MEANRCLVEVFKFMPPYDVLTAVSVVSGQWNKISTWPELWNHFCEQYEEDNSEETSLSPLQRYRALSTEHASFLVASVGTHLLLFNCLLEKTVASLEVKVNRLGTAVVLNRSSVLLCGGKDNSKGTTLVTFSKFSIEEMKESLYSHQFSGAAKVEGVVFVFGSNVGDGNAAEKFLLSETTWEAISPMPAKRSAFTPCVHKRTIFLCGGNVPESHTFNTTTEQYNTLPFTLPYTGWCIASYYHGSLYLEIAQNRFSWHPEKGTSMSPVSRYIVP